MDALRRAFWLESRSIAHRQVILDVAGELGDGGVTDLDVAELADALDTGRHRGEVMADFTVTRTEAIPGSPTLRLPDGTTVTNPGMTVHWVGPWAAGYPIVDADDPSVYDLLRRAAQPSPGQSSPGRSSPGRSSPGRSSPGRSSP
jgi:hypothetical protein